MPYKYVWVSDAAGECATLLFYVMTGLYFRPHAENPYFALQDDEISMAVRASQPMLLAVLSVHTTSCVWEPVVSCGQGALTQCSDGCCNALATVWLYGCDTAQAHPASS